MSTDIGMQADLKFFSRFPQRTCRARRPYPGEVDEALSMDGRVPDAPYYTVLSFREPFGEEGSVMCIFVPSPDPCPVDGLPEDAVHFLAQVSVLVGEGVPVDEAIERVLR